MDRNRTTLATILLLAGLVPLGLALSGCGASGGPAMAREIRLDFTPDQQAELATYSADAYTIRRGDVLSVRDMFSQQINQESVLVLPDGSATFFGLDQVAVEGLTLGQLDKLLTIEYAKEYRDPKVTVSVRELAPDYVYVLGEVRNPGMYRIQGRGFGVVAAIANAGGFKEYAQMGAVALIRVTPDGYLCRELDLAAIHNPSTFDPVLLDLQPFDVIFVSRNAIGDFKLWTEGVIGSLLKYTNLATDIRYIQSTEIFRR